MPQTLITAPSALPLTMQEIRETCRVYFTDRDAELSALCAEAVQIVETHTGRQLLTATWRLVLAAPPACDLLVLPRPPLVTVTGITYVDTAGESQAWSSAEWQAQGFAGGTAPGGYLRPRDGYTWPSVAPGRLDGFQVTFTCGYGSAGSSLPAGLRGAVRMVLEALYMREEPLAPRLLAILAPYVWRAEAI